jgi:hypothetical protein
VIIDNQALCFFTLLVVKKKEHPGWLIGLSGQFMNAGNKACLKKYDFIIKNIP